MLETTVENVLVKGLNAMTNSNELLQEQNKQLRQDIDGLKAKVVRLQEKLILETTEKE